MEIKRDYYLNRLIRSMHNGMVKVITGLRRCGKSFLLDPLFKDYLLSTGVPHDKIIKIDLPDISNQDLTNPLLLNDFILKNINKTDELYLFIDEIQLCKGIDNRAFRIVHTAGGEVLKISFYQILSGLFSN